MALARTRSLILVERGLSRFEVCESRAPDSKLPRRLRALRCLADVRCGDTGGGGEDRRRLDVFEADLVVEGVGILYSESKTIDHSIFLRSWS